jgi:hypothetical protein
MFSSYSSEVGFEEERLQVEICVNSQDNADALLSLFRWLKRDHELRRSAELSLASQGNSADMGAADVINIIFTQGISLLNLAVAYASWCGSRRHAPSITVRTDNAFVTLTGDSREVSEKALLSLLNETQHTDGLERNFSGRQDAGGAPGTAKP